MALGVPHMKTVAIVSRLRVRVAGSFIPAALLAGLVLGVLATAGMAQEGAVRGVHDPSVIKADGFYTLFSTGAGIPIRRSRDLLHWERAGRVFAVNPPWFQEAVPGSNWIWAPDISRRRGTYWLYYSVSTFGSNRSCIGLATNTTLDPSSPDYRWVDRGPVLSSRREDDWNAIDPNLVVDRDEQPYLVFGSYWSGIKLVRLDPDSGKPPGGTLELIALATRREAKAIEAPFLVQHGETYYLFVSFDHCCRGVNSDYKVMVGRSRSLSGPYLDRTGKPLLEGGGTLVLAGSGRMRGPGHNAIFRDGDKEWFIFHYYDAEFRGIQMLQIRPLHWTGDDWPEVGEPIAWPSAGSR